VLRTADASSLFGGLMPWAPTKSWSPQIQLNQAGDTALVEQESEPLEVFTFKSK